MTLNLNSSEFLDNSIRRDLRKQFIKSPWYQFFVSPMVIQPRKDSPTTLTLHGASTDHVNLTRKSYQECLQHLGCELNKLKLTSDLCRYKIAEGLCIPIKMFDMHPGRTHSFYKTTSKTSHNDLKDIVNIAMDFVLRMNELAYLFKINLTKEELFKELLKYVYLVTLDEHINEIKISTTLVFSRYFGTEEPEWHPLRNMGLSLFPRRLHRKIKSWCGKKDNYLGRRSDRESLIYTLFQGYKRGLLPITPQSLTKSISGLAKDLGSAKDVSSNVIQQLLTDCDELFNKVTPLKRTDLLKKVSMTTGGSTYQSRYHEGGTIGYVQKRMYGFKDKLTRFPGKDNQHLWNSKILEPDQFLGYCYPKKLLRIQYGEEIAECERYVEYLPKEYRGKGPVYDKDLNEIFSRDLYSPYELEEFERVPCDCHGTHICFTNDYGIYDEETFNPRWESMNRAHKEGRRDLTLDEIPWFSTYGQSSNDVCNNILRENKNRPRVAIAAPSVILEPLKARVITRPSVGMHTMMHGVQKHLHGYLQHPKFKNTFSLTSEKETPEFIYNHLKSSIERTTCDGFVSGDYSAATNKVSGEVSRMILRSYLKCQELDEVSEINLETCLCDMIIDLSAFRYPKFGSDKKNSYWNRAFKDVKGIEDNSPDDYGYPNTSYPSFFKQKNGQLMGNVISFPILCIANMLCYANAVRRFHSWLYPTRGYLKLSAIMSLYPVLINGDDILFCDHSFIDENCDRIRLSTIWYEEVNKYGFVPSPGKNLVSNSILQINSQLYYLWSDRQGISNIPIVNFGYITSRRKNDCDKDLTVQRIGRLSEEDSFVGRFKSMTNMRNTLYDLPVKVTERALALFDYHHSEYLEHFIPKAYRTNESLERSQFFFKMLRMSEMVEGSEELSMKIDRAEITFMQNQFVSYLKSIDVAEKAEIEDDPDQYFHELGLMAERCLDHVTIDHYHYDPIDDGFSVNAMKMHSNDEIAKARSRFAELYAFRKKPV